MKESELKKSVEQIRFTASRRQQIERQLARPLREMPADADIIMLEREDDTMKKSSKIAAFVGIAACIAVCVGVGVHLHGKVPAEKPAASDLGAENSESSTKSENRTGIVMNGDRTDYSVAHYAMTDRGFYAINCQECQQVFYHDNETNENVVLCAKPECLHDGDEFCVASSNNYANRQDLIYYDGYLYALAERIERQSDTQSTSHTVLLRYAPDGTAVDELANLSGEYTFGQQYEMLLYRGCLLIAVAESEGKSFTTEFGMDHMYYGGVTIYAYSIAAGKLSTLYTTMPLSEKPCAVPFGCPKNLVARGDTLYFLSPQSAGDYANPLYSGIYALDLLTGDLKKLVDGVSNMNRFFLLDDDLVYPDSVNVNFTSHTCFYRVSLATGEKTLWDCFWDAEQEKLIGNAPYSYLSLSAYDNHLVYSVDAQTESQQPHLSVMDPAGEFTDILFPQDAKQPDQPLVTAIQDGKIYAIDTNQPCLYAADWEDFINGKPNFEIVYENVKDENGEGYQVDFFTILYT